MKVRAKGPRKKTNKKTVDFFCHLRQSGKEGTNCSCSPPHKKKVRWGIFLFRRLRNIQRPLLVSLAFTVKVSPTMLAECTPRLNARQVLVECWPNPRQMLAKCWLTFCWMPARNFPSIRVMPGECSSTPRPILAECLAGIPEEFVEE